jgi:hypothetical protein
MPKRQFIKASGGLLLLVFMPIVLLCQSSQNWVITKVINTCLERGALKSSLDVDYSKKQDRYYIGKFVYIQDSLLFKKLIAMRIPFL